MIFFRSLPTIRRQLWRTKTNRKRAWIMITRSHWKKLRSFSMRYHMRKQYFITDKTNDTMILFAIHREPSISARSNCFFLSRSFSLSFAGAFDVSWEKYIDRGWRGCNRAGLQYWVVTRPSLLGNATASSTKFITFLILLNYNVKSIILYKTGSSRKRYL